MEIKQVLDVEWLDIIPLLGIHAAANLIQLERRIHRLSPRMAQFCHLWLKGYSVREIAEMCSVSEPNVTNMQKDGYVRLDCDDREDFMRRYGLIYVIMSERLDVLLESVYKK